MKVMFDANIALDAFQQRMPHQSDSAYALSQSLTGTITGCFPVHVVTTVYYILRKSLGKPEAIKTTRWLISTFEISPCDQQIVSDAAKSMMTDFEDAVLAYSAFSAGCDYIVTRNQKDFAQSPVSAISPAELLSLLAKSK